MFKFPNFFPYFPRKYEYLHGFIWDVSYFYAP
jgi:hypothetical protein